MRVFQGYWSSPTTLIHMLVRALHQLGAHVAAVDVGCGHNVPSVMNAFQREKPCHKKNDTAICPE